jgi:hypothetical protein
MGVMHCERMGFLADKGAQSVEQVVAANCSCIGGRTESVRAVLVITLCP